MEEDKISTPPFTVESIYGMNTNIPLVNLSRNDRNLIAYACSHVVTLNYYDFPDPMQHHLEGHFDCVRTLSTDLYGNWLLTADFGNEPVVNVWRVAERTLAFKLSQPHEEHRITAASLSPDSRYIVTVGNEPVQVLKIWDWTSADKTPPIQAKLPQTSWERVKQVCFGSRLPSTFALTSDRSVILGSCDFPKRTVLTTKPTIEGEESLFLHNSAFSTTTTRIFTGTAQGVVLVWNVGPDCQIKMIARAHVQGKAEITRIVYQKGIVVTGNSQGVIFFYDDDLKYLYHVSVHLESIGSIAFDIEASPPSEHLKFYQFEVGKHVPDDQHNPLNDKLVAVTTAGKTAIINMRALEYCIYCVYFHTTLTAMDVHPTRTNLVTSDKKRLMYLFDYSKNNRMLLKRAIPYLRDLRAVYEGLARSGNLNYFSEKDVKAEANNCRSSYASVLKYSAEGDVLICAIANFENGWENGLVWVLDPLLLQPLDSRPYKHSSSGIVDAYFSDCGHYLAFYDETGKVVVFLRNKRFLANENNYFELIGKIYSHKSSVLAMAFDPARNHDGYCNRLLSLGVRGDLREYDLSKRGYPPMPRLMVTSINIKLDENVPYSMVLYPTFGAEKLLLLCYSNDKFKLFKKQNHPMVATFLTPIFKTPINKMMIGKYLANEKLAYMIFATNNELGIQLLPTDGNPYKTVAMFAHPRQISWIRMSQCKNFIFTASNDDLCIIKWKINFSSVSQMNALGGAGLKPFYGLLNGGEKGLLLKEIKTMFSYFRIKMLPANKSDYTMSVKYVLDFMNSIGFYPTFAEASDLLKEIDNIGYQNNVGDARRLDFATVLKLYINHRPTRGVTAKQLEDAFCAIADSFKSKWKKQCCLEKNLLFKILLTSDVAKVSQNPAIKKARDHLRSLILGHGTTGLSRQILEQEDEREFMKLVRNLPNSLCYNDFATIILGVEL